jgi:predicted transcriptional regulator
MYYHFIQEGLITSEGRSKYRVTAQGVDWMMQLLREMRNYYSMAEKVVNGHYCIPRLLLNVTCRKASW